MKFISITIILSLILSQSLTAQTHPKSSKKQVRAGHIHSFSAVKKHKRNLSGSFISITRHKSKKIIKKHTPAKRKIKSFPHPLKLKKPHPIQIKKTKFIPVIKQAKWQVKRHAITRSSVKKPRRIKPILLRPRTPPPVRSRMPAHLRYVRPIPTLRQAPRRIKIRSKPIRDESGWAVALSVGPGFNSNTEGTQTFYLQSDIQKSYIAENTNASFVEGELFLGYQQMIAEKIIGQLGLTLATTNGATFKGSILEDANPELNNYFYHYQVRHSRVALKGKMLMDIAEMIQPYLHASVGLGYNQASNFVITPKIFEEVPAPPFSNGAQSSFAYTLGLGVQKAFAHHFQIGVGYEFADWGSSQLGRAPGQTLNSGLGQSNLYTNSLQLVLGYVG